MILRTLIVAFPLAFTCLHAVAEEQGSALIATKSHSLFTDNFQQDGLGDWKVVIPGFRVADGVLIGTQDREDHGAVGRVYLPMQDVIVSFRFRLTAATRFNVVFDDKNHKGSHAGHICRIAVSPQQIRLGDDREGIMRNDIFAMRRDPQQKLAAEKLLEGRSIARKVLIEPNQWYTMQVEIVGQQMCVSLDGQPVACLQSPGIAHPTKESLHFTVTGQPVHFDDVKIWQAVPNGRIRGSITWDR